MSNLPDEIWSKILEMGVQNPNNNNLNNRLNYQDLCRLSISSRRLHRLSSDHTLWSSLLSLDFPSNTNNDKHNKNSPKLIYKIRYEKDKARRIAAHMRAVLRVESRVAEHLRKLGELRGRRVEEVEKIESVVSELNNLHKVRQASVALNVWQPEVVRGRQKHIVEQCAVPVDSRINALEMELKLCKQQVKVYEKAYRDEKRRLEEAKEQLTSMKYHPLQNYSVIENGVGDHTSKRKKLKRCSTVVDEPKSDRG